MTPAVTFVACLALGALGLLAAFALKGARGRRSAMRPWMILGGWAVLVVGVIAAGPLLGAARGVFIASAALSFGALALVASGLQLRDARARAPREVALEPSDRASKAWRGWLRALLAGPIGGVAAMGVGLAWTVWTPGAPQTRMVLGGLLVPILWGGAMAWTLADDKILRATAVLVGVAVVTFTASALRGFS